MFWRNRDGGRETKQRQGVSISRKKRRKEGLQWDIGGRWWQWVMVLRPSWRSAGRNEEVQKQGKVNRGGVCIRVFSFGEERERKGLGIKTISKLRYFFVVIFIPSFSISYLAISRYIPLDFSKFS